MPQPDADTKVRCHRCSKFLGEALVPMELIAVVREKDLIDLIRKPRETRICKCGWTNVFVPTSQTSFRTA